MEEKMKLCRKCNVSYEDPELKFCSTCGTTLEEVNICPKCNAINPPDFLFCAKCGTKLNDYGKEKPVSNANPQPQPLNTVTDDTVKPQTTNVVDSCKTIPKPQIVNDRAINDASTNTFNWKIIIGGVIVVLGIVLALNKNNIELYLKYNDANTALKNGNFIVAVDKFTELGDYKDSKSLLNYSMASYVNGNPNNVDYKTYEYLKQLMANEPNNKDWETKYKEIYSWKIKILNLNQSKDDYSQNDNRNFARGSANNYLHFILDGGEPSTSTKIKYKWVSGSYVYENEYKDAHFDNLFHGFKGALVFGGYYTDITVTFYDSNNNKIGEVTMFAK